MYVSESEGANFWLGLLATCRRVLCLLEITKEERYQYLLENHPVLFQRVPVSNLASYLGMSLASIKRVRANM